jgi:hypothetical protein
MSDEQTELERQIFHLTAEVARLRRSVIFGFAVIGVLIVTGFADQTWGMIVGAIVIVIWAVILMIHVGISLVSVLRRCYIKRGHDVV